MSPLTEDLTTSAPWHIDQQGTCKFNFTATLTCWFRELWYLEMDLKPSWSSTGLQLVRINFTGILTCSIWELWIFWGESQGPWVIDRQGTCTFYFTSKLTWSWELWIYTLWALNDVTNKSCPPWPRISPPWLATLTPWLNTLPPLLNTLTPWLARDLYI